MKTEVDYVYDVFVSYTRNHPVGTWVSNRFFRDFVGYLSGALGRDARVFFDQRDIAAGEDWERKLQWALGVSRVLLAVCSARYFYDSDYCQMEWCTFGDVSVEGGIVRRPRVPLRYNDGDRFPPEAKVLQQVDFSEANLIIEAFYKHDVRAIAYEDKVRTLAGDVAVAIAGAPPFSVGFPISKPPKVPLPPMKQPRL
jgi:hypothetical protein